MRGHRIETNKRSAERRLGSAVAGSTQPVRRRRAIFDQASKLGLKNAQRHAELLDRAAKDADHPVKHKFVDQKQVITAEAKLSKAVNVAARRKAWAERDRGALALRGVANVILNLLIFCATLTFVLFWIGVI
ncbi:MAG: hypothetical protein AAFR98_13405 [Pseudomonadota bacterium]